EEMEHWAYCIRNKDPENKPRCHPNVAMGDAIIALTSNVAIHNANSGKAGFVKFEKSWFDIDDPSTPDGSSVEEERKSLGA
ncbi:MAG: gfo/Idh/MocA family oxidoreductase, partial [Pirellulaceae bacterium]|nr:gfo/Idh/MocA family oxidoreductase [Pirellulaceae bacterium]